MSTAPDVRVAQDSTNKDDSAKLTKLSYAEDQQPPRSPKDFPAKVPVQAAQTDVAKPAKPAGPQSAKTSNQAQNQVQNPIQKSQERLQKDPPAKLPAQIAKADGVERAPDILGRGLHIVDEDLEFGLETDHRHLELRCVWETFVVSWHTAAAHVLSQDSNQR